MFELLLELFRYMITMLFGTFLSAVFLRIEMTRRNVLILAAFSCLALALQGCLYASRGVDFITLYYPLIVHLPLMLVFTIVFYQKIFHGIFAIATAYFCCQIANWISMIPAELQGDSMAVNLTYTITLIATFVLICKYAGNAFASVYSKPLGEFLLFAIVPVFYYVFDYIFTVYSEMLYSKNILVAEFAPFLLCLTYMFFCSLYFKQFEEKLEVEQYNQMMEIKHEQAEKNILTIKQKEQELSLLRHDMRHFLVTIAEYLEHHEIEKAKLYIQEIIDFSDRSSRKKYCANETVNMILSYFEKSMEERGIELSCDLQIPSTLQISDVDLTSILSNGLENAIDAVTLLSKEKRIIEFSMTERGGKLLISIKNPYGKIPRFRNGMPISVEAGHGYGSQSIRYTVEKLGGNCHFSMSGENFILRIIL